MDENEELLNVIREVIDRFGMDKEEVKEEGIPEALFHIVKSQTYLPVRSIKQQWLEEEKLYKELGSVKNNGKEPETYSEEQDYYLPSEDFLEQIFDS
jgi:predicted nucleotidyltransferase